MNIESSRIPNRQAPKVREPSKGALYDPAMLAQFRATLDPTSGNPGRNTPSPERLAVGFAIVAFVGVQLGRASTRSAPSPFEGWDSVKHHLQRGRIGNVRSCTPHREGNAASADHKMALRAWFAPIRWVGADGLAPFFARMLVESTQARDQSISPAWLSWSNSSLCIRSQTPACCQSRSLRQHVMPLPISCGSSSHWMPLLSTNKMPVKAARLGTRGRPPFGLVGSAGNSGSITAHNSSGNCGFAMPHSTSLLRFC